MTLKIVWTEQAFVRVAEIYDFIATNSPAAADQFVSRLQQCAEQLPRFPESGRRVPELPASDLREVIEGNYRIVYRVRGAALEIITVFEGHMLFPVQDTGVGGT